MADGLHIPIWNRAMKPLAIAVIEQGEDWGEDMIGAIWPMYNICLIGIIIMNNALYNEYIPRNIMRLNLK
jgi:hypothetical protein